LSGAEPLVGPVAIPEVREVEAEMFLRKKPLNFILTFTPLGHYRWISCKNCCFQDFRCTFSLYSPG